MNTLLKHALLSRTSPYYYGLPYNLNWEGQVTSELLSCLQGEVINFVDIGCRGGLVGELDALKKYINFIGFDADQGECQRLNGKPHDLFARTLYPVFIDEIRGTRKFLLYENLGESSAFPFDSRYMDLFRGNSCSQGKTISVTTISLDEFIEQQHLQMPDVLKIDTQGTELAVLKGAEKCLETASLVEVEVEFLQIYKGQPLFHDVMEFMFERGFDFVYLNRFFQQRSVYKGIAKGQITFGDALFVKREDRMDKFGPAQKMKAIILLINYGHADIAYDIFRANDWPDDVREVLVQFFTRMQGRGSCSRLREGVRVLVDKLILLLLHLRKHNGQVFDSDRSWPIR